MFSAPKMYIDITTRKVAFYFVKNFVKTLFAKMAIVCNKFTSQR